MDDSALPTSDINDKLRWEEERLEQLKESLDRSDQLTDNMLTILSSFESRLRKLEDTITPVYQETGNLQRRHENIEKTLNCLAHVIGYYHIAEEVEPTISKGPSAGLENYLQCMKKLQEAVRYFTTNNPGSQEMADVTALYEAGTDSLEREFRNLLHRHSKPVPAVAMLDIMTNDEELPNEEPQAIEHLPEHIKKELCDMATWLQTCGDVSDYMQVYGTIRSSILIHSLQGLRDHLKSGSKDSSNISMAHSPALGQKLKSGKDTPSRRAIKRMAFVRKASTTLMKHSLAHLEAADEITPMAMSPRRMSVPAVLTANTTRRGSVFQPRDVERRRSSIHQLKEGLKRSGTGSSDKIEEETEVDIDFYITGVSALLKLIQSESALMEGIIPEKHQRKVFELIITAALDSIVREGEQIASNIRRAIARHDHQAVLAIFPVLKHLRSVKPDFDVTLETTNADTLLGYFATPQQGGCPPPTRAKLVTLISTLDSAGAKALEEFVDSIRNDKSSHMPKDGTVHELTSNTMIFLEQLLEFADTAGAMLMTQDPTALSTVQSPDKPKVKLAEFITKVLSALGLNLSIKSETYNDVTLRAIFMLNNYNYILKALRRTRLIDITDCWDHNVAADYDKQVLEHKRIYSQRTKILELVQLLDPRTEHHYDQQISDQKKYYAHSWSRVLHYIMETNVARTLAKASSPEGGKLKDKDRQAIKDKFTGFNKELEDICRVQKGYAIPDVELRETLKQDNKDFILPKYKAFYDKYTAVNFTKNVDKYIKYTPDDVKGAVNNFFDAAA